MMGRFKGFGFEKVRFFRNEEWELVEELECGL
jgi:hypothetical protein